MFNYSQCLTLGNGSKNRRCLQNQVFKRFMFSHTGGALDLAQMPDLNIHCGQGCTDLHGVHHSFITTSNLKRAEYVRSVIDEYNKRVDATKVIKLVCTPEPIITFPQGAIKHLDHEIYSIIMCAKSTRDPSFWEMSGSKSVKQSVMQTQPLPQASLETGESDDDEIAETTGKRKRSGDLMEMCREFMSEQEKLKEENRKLRATVQAQEAAAAESVKTIESLREENSKLTQSLASSCKEITVLKSDQRKVNALKDSIAPVMAAWLALLDNSAA
jgi:metal-responsive CopG/Arc/MetJ family transcriptional regulator